MANMGKKRVARKGAKKGKSKPKTKVSAPLRKAIKAIALSQQETKYVGETIVANNPVAAFATTPVGLTRILPVVAQGNADDQRIGDKIKPIRATTRWVVHFQNGVSTNFEDLQYNLIVLMVKGAKNAAAVASQPGGTLLRNGGGGNTDPNGFTQAQFIEQVNHFPVNTDQYVVLKRFRHRFAKGSYDVTGVPGANATSQIAVQSPCVTFEYKWNPPDLDYNTGVDVLPTNHYPVFIHWVSVNDAGVYSGNLFYGCRTDMYYKDA